MTKRLCVLTSYFLLNNIEFLILNKSWTIASILMPIQEERERFIIYTCCSLTNIEIILIRPI